MTIKLLDASNRDHQEVALKDDLANSATPPSPESITPNAGTGSQNPVKASTSPGPTGAVAEIPAGRPRGRHRWRWFALLVVVLGMGGVVWYVLAQGGGEQTQLVLQGNIDVRQVNLSFKVDGRIATLLVDEGDTVKAGQVVATLEKVYFDNELRVARASRANLAAAVAKLKHGSRPEEIAQARAQLGQQEANLTMCRANLKRGEELSHSGGISKEDVDQRREAVGVGEANVQYANQTLRLAVIGPRQEDIDAGVAQLAQQDASIVETQRRLADSELVAPSDGFILTRAEERGAILKAGATVFTLTLASPVWVRTYVNEHDLGLIYPGMAAQATTDTMPDRPYSGQIGFISPTAEFTPKTVETRELRTDLVYRLRVMMDDPDGGLRQGMPVTVSLPLAQPRPRTFWQRVRTALHLERR